MFVLVHGLDGFSSDMDFFKAKLNSLKCDLFCFAPTANHWNTKDGITRGATRILLQIEQQIKEQTHITKISYLGHSLGGLYAREVIYLAHLKNSPVAKLTPMNFITLASPHMGGREHTMVVRVMVPLLLGQTGREMMLVDDQKEPHLLKMASMNYLDLLNMFKKAILYSNVNNDVSVSYCTSAIRSVNRYKDINLEHGTIIEDNDNIQRSVVDLTDAAYPSISKHVDSIRVTLNQVKWVKFACFFNRPLLAHTDIINKSMMLASVWLKDHPVIDHIGYMVCECEDKERTQP
jgi:hypothetical protein